MRNDIYPGDASVTPYSKLEPKRTKRGYVGGVVGLFRRLEASCEHCFGEAGLWMCRPLPSYNTASQPEP